MGLINWIFDIYQHSKIDSAQRETAQLRAELAQVRRGDAGGGVDARRLEDALGELALATKTLQRVLVDKGVCSHAELADKLRQVDREDGREDGRAPI